MHFYTGPLMHFLSGVDIWSANSGSAHHTYQKRPFVRHGSKDPTPNEIHTGEPLAKLRRANAQILDGRCTEIWDRGDLTWFR